MIRGLHHSAYRCRDPEATRRFYEDFLGLPLAEALEIDATKTGRATHTLHSIYFCDPNGYVIELTAKRPRHEQALGLTLNDARGKLERWQAAKDAEAVVDPPRP